jgi:multidrug efflux pump subunit AcrB
MLLPGLLGKFMFVVPFVVTLALVISLIEAYWMLPAHVAAADLVLDNEKPIQKMRVRMLHRIRLFYCRWLLRAMRFPRRMVAIVIGAFALAISTIPLGLVKLDFFASDPLQLFYVNVTMPAGTPLEETLSKAVEIEQQMRKDIQANEARSIVSYSGLMFTETEPFMGDRYGQVVVSLNPHQNGMRRVDEIVDSLREKLRDYPGPEEVSFLELAGGPPTAKPITIKVRGDRFDEIAAGAKALTEVMENTPGVKDISIDTSPRQNELQLQLNYKAIREAGLNPLDISRILRLYIDGELLTTIQSQGEELDVRMRAAQSEYSSVDALLRQPVSLPAGGHIPLGQLVTSKRTESVSRIRHYNFRRSVEVSADIDKSITNEVKANEEIMRLWNEQTAAKHPNIALDTSGILDDVFEAMDWMVKLFMLGVLLMYLILGTQFRSYFQPFLILITVPLAFTGVVLGLLITRNPLSLYTMYGVVALAGIAVNSAIVLISAANSRRKSGMSILHATVYAARRRVVPIIITSMTTIGGLFSLAVGLGGYSLMWGPMALSIVCGLAFSTLLTLFVVPVLYEYAMRLGERFDRRGGFSNVIKWLVLHQRLPAIKPY